jgi:hypothetical protein
MRMCEVLCLLALLACGGRRAPIETPPVVAADAAPTPDAPVRDAAVNAVALDAAPPDGFDLATWLATRGVTGTPEDLAQSCAELVVGADHEPAILCYLTEDVTRAIRGSDMPAYRVVERNLVRVVRANKLVTLLDVPLRFQALDAPPRPLDAPPLPSRFEVAPDGQSIQVGIPDDDAVCKDVANRAARALARLAAGDKEGRAWIVLDRDLQTRVCAARGRYVWRGGRFVR